MYRNLRREARVLGQPRPREPRLASARSLAWLWLLSALLLAGCPSPRAPQPAPAASPSPGVQAPSPRVLTASPALAEMVCALGAREHLVGVSRYCVYPPSLAELPQIGGAIDPNLEEIDRIAPDLILLQGEHAGLSELALRRGWGLERFRIEQLADTLSALERLGQLLGCPEAAQGERSRLERALAAAKAQAPARAPRTLLVFGRQPGSLTQLSCPGEGTFLSECLSAVGGQTCLEGLPGYPMISAEVLLERAPELIVELFAEPVDAETRAELRADWAALSAIPAVARGRIAIVSGESLLVPGPRLDQTLDKLGRAISGELDVE